MVQPPPPELLEVPLLEPLPELPPDEPPELASDPPDDELLASLLPSSPLSPPPELPPLDPEVPELPPLDEAPLELVPLDPDPDAPELLVVASFSPPSDPSGPFPVLVDPPHAIPTPIAIAIPAQARPSLMMPPKERTVSVGDLYLKRGPGRQRTPGTCIVGSHFYTLFSEGIDAA
jgi:hypothetical protein